MDLLSFGDQENGPSETALDGPAPAYGNEPGEKIEEYLRREGERFGRKALSDRAEDA